MKKNNVAQKAKKNGLKENDNYEIKTRFIVILVAIIFISIILSINIILKNIGKNITETSDILSMDVSSNKSKIKELYETSDQLNNFIVEQDKVQTSVGKYILENSTMESNSFANIKEKLDIELQKSEWESLDVKRSKFWSGSWILDETGTVKFKFSSKEIEPNWINDEKVNKLIIKN